jgi:hypothetical protein
MVAGKVFHALKPRFFIASFQDGPVKVAEHRHTRFSQIVVDSGLKQVQVLRGKLIAIVGSLQNFASQVTSGFGFHRQASLVGVNV